ncbi:MAG TPA: hypothetical protein DCQ06_03380 [Myxococcales bacterium]|nr:hypothetical protein [Myxococcales bacterium]HAN30618.1 hypothetical protein [Myxococcales bacterium]
MTGRFGFWGALLSIVLISVPTQAAEVTDVLDAFDKKFNNPYDLSLRVRFAQQSRSAMIGREVRCIGNDHVGAEACPNGSQTLLSRELDYSRTRRVMFIDARIGIHHDVELYANIPLVLSDNWSHRFLSGVDANNSRFRPATNNSALFAVPYKSNDRSGLGDMSIGLKWSPYNYYRDTAHPTWVLGFEYKVPTGTPMEASNNSVGMGLHELHFFTTISRRALRILEPFFNLHARVNFESDNSLFRKTRQADTQVRVTPGNVIGTAFGLEIIPWEDLSKDTRVELEFGFSMDYIFRGREYTEVWEALASPDNPCQQSLGCSNTSHTKSDLDPDTGRHATTNGITDVEQYGRFAGWLSLHYQPVKSFQVSAMFNYAVDSPHFITFGDYGKDLDEQGGVRQSNTAKPPANEYSPVFLPSVDAPGGRLRLQQAATWTFMLSLSGKL